MLIATTLVTLVSTASSPAPAPAPFREVRRPLSYQDEVVAALAAVVPPDEHEGHEEHGILWALKNGRYWLSARYRFENASQDGFAKESYASTIRTRLGYRTGSWHNISGLIEFEDVSPVIDDSFNSTLNGKTNRPIVADPDVSEVNQVYLEYEARNRGLFRLGRQRIKLGNLRWVGNVGWRQNEQTYDGGSASWEFRHGTSAFYSYVTNVNTVTGGDRRMDSHLFNLYQELEVLGLLTLYGYRLNFDVSTGNEPSTKTIGARLAGEHEVADDGAVTWAAEFAKQHDASGNTVEINANYLLAELGWKCDDFWTKVGYESLGGSGMAGNALQTPLATLHAHNGWADKFLVTPNEGLVDAFAVVGKQFGKTRVRVVYHDYEAEHGPLDFGKEVDLEATRPFGDHVTVGAAYANYMAEDNSVSFALTETNKVWFWVSLAI